MICDVRRLCPCWMNECSFKPSYLLRIAATYNICLVYIKVAVLTIYVRNTLEFDGKFTFAILLTFQQNVNQSTKSASANSKSDSSNSSDAKFAAADLLSPAFVNALPVQSLYRIASSDKPVKAKKLSLERLHRLVDYRLDGVDVESISYGCAERSLRQSAVGCPSSLSLSLSPDEMRQRYKCSSCAILDTATLFAVDALVSADPALCAIANPFRDLKAVVRCRVSLLVNYEEYLLCNGLSDSNDLIGRKKSRKDQIKNVCLNNIY